MAEEQGNFNLETHDSDGYEHAQGEDAALYLNIRRPALRFSAVMKYSLLL